MVILNRIAFVFFIILMLVNCKGTELVKSLSSKKINFEYKDGVVLHFYKKEPISGKYKLFEDKGNYTIGVYKNGYLNGKRIIFHYKKKSEEGIYENGLLNGKKIEFSNNEIKEEINYKQGFVWGDNIIYKENSCLDTLIHAKIYSSKEHMDIYLQKESDVTYQKLFDINLLLNAIEIKDNYPQRFYLKNDSSLLMENIWYKINDFYFVRKKQKLN